MAEHNQPNGPEIPRREFIQRSLIASGGVFLGMGIEKRVATPPTTGDGMPQFASSRRFGNNGVGNGLDPQPPGNPPVNDGPGTGPGNPGNRGGPN